MIEIASDYLRSMREILSESYVCLVSGMRQRLPNVRCNQLAKLAHRRGLTTAGSLSTVILSQTPSECGNTPERSLQRPEADRGLAGGERSEPSEGVLRRQSPGGAMDVVDCGRSMFIREGCVSPTSRAVPIHRPVGTQLAGPLTEGSLRSPPAKPRPAFGLKTMQRGGMESRHAHTI